MSGSGGSPPCVHPVSFARVGGWGSRLARRSTPRHRSGAPGVPRPSFRRGSTRFPIPCARFADVTRLPGCPCRARAPTPLRVTVRPPPSGIFPAGLILPGSRPGVSFTPKETPAGGFTPPRPLRGSVALNNDILSFTIPRHAGGLTKSRKCGIIIPWRRVTSCPRRLVHPQSGGIFYRKIAGFAIPDLIALLYSFHNSTAFSK